MADTLRIKRRSSGNPGAPASLAYAELAFNEVDNILYYGRGNNAGQAVTIIPIAGPGFVPPATPPGGSNTQVQFNDGGAFGGDAGLTYDKNTDTLTAGDIKVAQWNGVSAPVELKLQSTGGGWGTSILRIKNETGVNGAMFETVPNPGAELVDFVFKVGTITQQNIRLEARPSGLTSGNSWEFQIGSAGNAQFVVGNSITRTQLLTVKSDGTLNISIGGQTTLQYDPNTNNGTFTLGAKPPHGQLLKFCARSDITGSARFFGAANYSFDANIDVTGTATLSVALPIASGGTNAKTAPLALDSLSGASGATAGVLTRASAGTWSVEAASGGGSTISVGDTPPATPTDNSLWWETDSGILWLRYNDSTSVQWIAVSGPPGPSSGLFLPLNGGTLTNGIAIQPASGWAAIDLKKSGSGQANVITGQTGSSYRWWLYLGDNVAETGSNVGSDFVVGRWSDAGASIDYPFRIARSNGQAWFSSPLNAYQVLIKPGSGNASVILTGVANEIYGFAASNAQGRWMIQLGDGSSESGSNTGSNFVVHRYADNGSYLGAALTINRATGWITSNRPVLALENGFSPTNIDAAGIKSQGSYGGGLFLLDGTGRCGIYCDGTGANLRFAIGNATSVTVPAYFTTSATYNSTGVWSTTSDASLKSNVQDYTRGLADLIMLRPVTFTFARGTPFSDPDETPRIGLIAQEVEPYIPEIVGEVEATIGEELVPVKTLESGSLIFAVLNALREIDSRLKALEERFA